MAIHPAMNQNPYAYEEQMRYMRELQKYMTQMAIEKHTEKLINPLPQPQELKPELLLLGE